MASKIVTLGALGVLCCSGMFVAETRAQAGPPAFSFEYMSTIFYKDTARRYQPITWSSAPSVEFVRARFPRTLPGDNYANINCHRITLKGVADCEVFDAAPASSEWKAFALKLVKQFHRPSRTAGTDMREVMIALHVMIPARPGIGRVCIPPFCQPATAPSPPPSPGGNR